jgi:hypothetical protein
LNEIAKQLWQNFEMSTTDITDITALLLIAASGAYLATSYTAIKRGLITPTRYAVMFVIVVLATAFIVTHIPSR